MLTDYNLLIFDAIDTIFLEDFFIAYKNTNSRLEVLLEPFFFRKPNVSSTAKICICFTLGFDLCMISNKVLVLIFGD